MGLALDGSSNACSNVIEIYDRIIVDFYTELLHITCNSKTQTRPLPYLSPHIATQRWLFHIVTYCQLLSPYSLYHSLYPTQEAAVCLVTSSLHSLLLLWLLPVLQMCSTVFVCVTVLIVSKSAERGSGTSLEFYFFFVLHHICFHREVLITLILFVIVYSHQQHQTTPQTYYFLSAVHFSLQISC